MLKTLVTMILVYSLAAATINNPPVTVPSSANSRATLTKKPPRPGCSACAAGSPTQSLGDRLDSLASLGRRTQVSPLIPIHSSIFKGSTFDYVSTATGEVSFAVNDLGISGAMPIVFQRVYSSNRGNNFGLGVGWSFIFDDRITVDKDTATLFGGEGQTVAFRADGGGRKFRLTTPAPQMHQSFEITDQGTITEKVMGTTRTYSKVGNAYRLSRINDRGGNQITIAFDAHSNITQVAGSGGYFSLQWSDSKEARLLSVTDSAGRRVEFKQDDHLLREVRDSTDSRWSYDYANDRLTVAVDPLDRKLLQARYDRAGRAVEVRDAGASFGFEYGSGSISRRTVVTDTFGVKTFFEHNRMGATTSVGEDGGPPLLRIEYTETNRPTRLSNSIDGETNYVFDAQNRLLQSSAADGSTDGYAYDDDGQVSAHTSNGVRTEYTRNSRQEITTVKSSEPGRNHRTTYNSRGQVMSIESDDGRQITNEYDNAGRTTAFTLNRKERFETEFDRAGNVSAEKLPSGLVTRYERDGRGRLTRQSDSNGRSLRIERDAGGALALIVKPDGSWLRAVRDEQGRIAELNSSAGRSRRFAYDARGALTDYTDGSGQHKHFEYDRRGRLSSINDDNGRKTSVDRSVTGQINRISVVNRNGSRVDYDRNGRVVAAERASVRQPTFLKAEYSRSTLLDEVLAPEPQDPECMFGFDPVFNASQQGWDNCWDPYGGFGGGDFGGGPGCGGSDFDPFGSGTGGCPMAETPAQCIVRQKRICLLEGSACVATATGNYMYALGGCAAITFINPAAGAICVAAAASKQFADVTACGLRDAACTLAAPDKCPH